LAVVGPVFKKELLEAARRKRYILLRCIIPALFLFVVVVIALEEGGRRRDSNETILKQQNRAGRNFFEAWSLFLTMTLGVAAPMLVGGLIAAERERGSLDLLFTTDLSSREIVLGKAASRIAILWLMAFGSAPALEIIAVLGGVSFEQVFGLLLVTLSGAAFIVSVGLYYSAVTKRPWIAIVRTYFFFGVLWAVLPVVFVGTVEFLRHVLGSRDLMRWFESHLELLAVYLPVCIIAQIEPRLFGSRATDFAIWNSVFSWVAAAFFLFLAHRNLRELQVRSATRWWWAPVRWAQRLWHLALWPMRFIGRFFRFLPRPSEAHLQRFLDRQPVAWRNFKGSVFDPDRYLFKIQRFLGIALLGFLVLGSLAWHPPPARDYVVFVVLTVGVTHFLLTVLIAGSVSRERERGSLDLLRMTMLTPHQIIVGNAAGAFRAVRFSLGVLAFLMVFAVVCNIFTFTFTIPYTLLVLLGMLCIASQAMLVSIAAPTTVTAMAAAVVVGFIWWIAPLCLADNDSRGVSIGVVGAVLPLAILPVSRTPKPAQWMIAITASGAVLVYFAQSRIENSWIVFGLCACAAILALRRLHSPFIHMRLVAACVVCVTVTAAVGLLPSSVRRADFRRLDDVMTYPRYVVDVDRNEIWVDNSYMRRTGTTRWSGSESGREALTFFLATLASTALLHWITIRSFPRLTQSS